MSISYLNSTDNTVAVNIMGRIYYLTPTFVFLSIMVVRTFWAAHFRTPLICIDHVSGTRQANMWVWKFFSEL